MDADDLVQIAQIEALKYRYGRLLDTKRWDELAECFMPDATASYGGGQYSFTGRDQIMAFLRKALGSTNALTSHTMTQPEIELVDAGRARGTWALHDIVILVEMGIVVRGASFYEDEYVRADHGWRFSHTGYRRVWEEMVPRAADASLTASWFDTDGVSTLPAP